jgi:MoaA/NifB/PqqE/SkfB family radical SAM enzyme
VNVNLFSKYNCEFFPTIGLKITNKCRMQCGFCCEPDRSKTTPTFNIIEPILIKLSNWGTKRICITGGEPLLHDQLNKIIESIKRLEMKSVLLTADPEKVINNINAIENVDQVRISVHGYGDIHNKIVGRGNCFEQFEKAIRILKKKNLKVSITTVVSKKNIDEAEKIANWAKALGVEEYFIFGLMNSGNGIDYIDEYGKLTSMELETLVNNLKYRFADHHFSIKCYSYDRNAECIIVYGTGEIIIDPYPLAPKYQLSLGNLNVDSKSKILNNFLKDENNLFGYNKHLEEALL